MTGSPTQLNDEALAGQLAGLRTSAPDTLLPWTLIDVGLADAYAAIDSPIGPLFVAFNGLGVSTVEQAAGRRDLRSAVPRRTGRTRAIGSRRCPTGSARRSTDGSAGDRRSRIALDLRGRTRVRAGRLDEGPRDPARRGPAVRLDRGRDRPAEGGAGGRHRARAQPGAAHRPVPPGRPERRDDRPVLARRAGTTSGRSSPPKAWTPTSSRRWPGPGSATSAPTRRTSTACRPVAQPGGSDRAIGSRSGRPATAIGRAIEPAGSAGPRPPRSRPEPRSRRTPSTRGRPAIRPARPARPGYAPHLDQPTQPSAPVGVRTAASPIAIWAGLLTLYFVWGSTYIAIRLGVETIPPFLMAASRFLVAGAILLTWEALAAAGSGTTRACRWPIDRAARTGANGVTRRSSALRCCSAGWAWSRSARRPCRPASPRSSSRCCRSGWPSSVGSSSVSGYRRR